MTKSLASMSAFFQGIAYFLAASFRHLVEVIGFFYVSNIAMIIAFELKIIQDISPPIQKFENS